MKRVLVPMIAAILLLGVPFVYAADVKIGVVDVNRVMKESSKGQKASADLDSMVKQKQAEMNSKGTNLEKMKAELEKESDKAARAKKEAEFNKAASEYQKSMAESQNEVKKKADELRGQVLADIRNILATIGNDEKFTAILISDAVGFYVKSIDLTDKVVKTYNEKPASK